MWIAFLSSPLHVPFIYLKKSTSAFCSNIATTCSNAIFLIPSTSLPSVLLLLPPLFYLQYFQLLWHVKIHSQKYLESKSLYISHCLGQTLHGMCLKSLEIVENLLILSIFSFISKAFTVLTDIRSHTQNSHCCCCLNSFSPQYFFLVKEKLSPCHGGW